MTHPSMLVVLVALAIVVAGAVREVIPIIRRWYLLTRKHICPDCRFNMVSRIRGCGSDPFSVITIWYCPKLTHRNYNSRMYNPCERQGDRR